MTDWPTERPFSSFLNIHRIAFATESLSAADKVTEPTGAENIYGLT